MFLIRRKCSKTLFFGFALFVLLFVNEQNIGAGMRSPKRRAGKEKAIDPVAGPEFEAKDEPPAEGEEEEHQFRRAKKQKIDMSKKAPAVDYDAIVVGSGIIGSGIGLKLAESGKRTLILEQFKRGHPNGSSHGGSRIMRYTHSDEMWIPLVRDAYWEWENLQQKWNKFNQKRGKPNEQIYIVNGLLTMDFQEQNTMDRAEVLRKNNINHEVLRGAQITEKFPHLQNYDDQWTTIYEPQATTLLADKCLNAIQELFLHTHGTKIHEEEKFLSFENDPLWPNIVKVITDKGVYTARHLVIAVGGWLPLLFPSATDLPVRTEAHLLASFFWRIKSHPELFNPFSHSKSSQTPLRSPMLLITTPATKQENGEPYDGHPEFDELYGLPGADYPNQFKFNIHLGKKIEHAIKLNDGQKKLVDGQRAVDIEPCMYQKLQKHLQEHIPDVDATQPNWETSSSCIYTMTKDEKFIIDHLPAGNGNVLVAGGFSGTGFKYGLTVGKIVQQMVAGVGQPRIVDESGKKQQKPVDMTPFSAKRVITEDTLKVKLR